MCTVTFIRNKDLIFFTSSRDEKVQRSQASPPGIYHVNDTRLMFPKDADAGGTWIAVRDNLNAAVLLNGAFKSHLPMPPYKRSRGLILIDILASPDSVRQFLQFNLKAIEPFTLILLKEFLIFECRWDGNEKYCKQLSTDQNHIWSSATLYDLAIQQRREVWFEKWQRKNPQPTRKDIFNFHQFAGDGDEENDILMNRQGQLFTVSITGIQLTRESCQMTHLDLKDGMTYLKYLDLAVDCA